MRNLAFTVLLLLCTAFAQAQFTPDPQALYQSGINKLIGSPQTQSVNGALNDLEQSAQLGYVPAQIALGTMYDRGDYVTATPGLAASYYRKAAEQGDPLAEWLLGRMYYLGSGVSRDLPQAERWLRPAAEQGNPFAQQLLGLVMKERDYTKAAPFFLAAARQGLPQSQRELAVLLADGRGVAQNRSDAYAWLIVAADGNRRADPLMQRLEGDLGVNGVELAKSRAEEWKQTFTRNINAHGCTGWSGEFDDVPAPPPLETQRFCH